MSIDGDAENGRVRPSMLLAFRGRNARSFREEFELSLLATTLAEPGVVREVPWRAGGKPMGVLPVAGLHGANATGKSNVLRAMADMRNHVLFSFPSADPRGGMPRRSFLLGTDPAAPSRYEGGPRARRGAARVRLRAR